MQMLWQDLQYAVRGLRKNPGFTLVVLFTLAFGVGANTGVFSLANALLLRAPAGVSKPDEILLVGRTFKGSDANTFSYPDYADCRAQNQSFADLAAYRETDILLDASDSPQLVSGLLVSGNYFTALGTHSARGRLLSPEDDSSPGANAVAVISHGLWERRFASDPNIVGQVINLNNFPFTIVGVMQPEFTGTGVAETIEVWLPLTMYSQAVPVFYEKRLEARQISWLNVLGRRKPGISILQAQADLTNISRRLEQIYPDIDKGLGVSVVNGLGLEPRRRDEARARMGILLSVAGLILLIVCANVANLLLARGAARRKEMAVRQALGAGRIRLLRQLLTEGLLLSTIGGALGIVIAFWSRRLLLSSNVLTGVRLLPEDLKFDARVLGFGLLVSLATGLIFGLVPAFEASNLDLQFMLKDRSANPLQRVRFSGALVTGQIALTLVVLISASLFLQTLRNTQSVDPGFDIDKIVLMPIDIGRLRYSEEQGRQFYQSLTERVRAMPGVASVSLSVTAPLGGSWRNGIRREGQPSTEPETPCDYDIVAPRYFETAGIALLQGRDFSEQDRANSPRIVIVNQTFAQRWFPGNDALGKRLSIARFPGDNSYSEIVGVAKDVKYEALTESPRPYFYLPLSQQYQSGAILMIRARGDEASSLAGAIAREVQALDRNLISRPRTLAERLQAAVAPQRSAATMLAIFGLLGLGLASVGLYGVLAYSVRQRQQELGVRMALGANRRDILKLVLKQGSVLIITGVVLGLAIAFAATRTIAGLLYGVSPVDPITYAVVTIVLLISALGACYIPARRATKVDPLVALRYE